MKPEISKYMSEIGKKGAKVTNSKLTKKKRTERARKGGLAKAKNFKKK